MGASPLVDRAPARAANKHDAVTLALALALAEAEARCGNTTRARQALEAAQALDPDAVETQDKRRHAR